jgi:2-polyprenyl-3-methyl-5-hydroxy-6-metoxy-1,4-benzoquinol methylase
MKHMYDHVARQINRLSPVIDLGCGCGYLASALSERGYIGRYRGIDLSPVAVDMATRALTKDNGQLQLFEIFDDIPFVFETGDLHDYQWEVTRDTHRTIFTCFEVLEHVEDDKAIVDSLPARSRFIFSVPNYWSGSHIRTFDSMGTAKTRYSEWLTVNSIHRFPTKQPEAAIYLYDTIRRSDKW